MLKNTWLPDWDYPSLPKGTAAQEAELQLGQGLVGGGGRGGGAVEVVVMVMVRCGSELPEEV